MSDLIAAWYAASGIVALWSVALGMLIIGAFVGDAIGRFLVRTAHRAIRNADIRRNQRNQRNL